MAQKLLEEKMDSTEEDIVKIKWAVQSMEQTIDWLLK